MNILLINEADSLTLLLPKSMDLQLSLADCCCEAMILWREYDSECLFFIPALADVLLVFSRYLAIWLLFDFNILSKCFASKVLSFIFELEICEKYLFGIWG